LFFEEGGPGRVMGGSDCMLTAVKLDDQLPIPTAEVHEVRSDRHLARELHAEEAAVTQPRPQPALGIGLSSTQPTREISR
jgi:hypothetical protein